MEYEFTTIRISLKTKARFYGHGQKNQSSDELLNEILDAYEKVK